MRRRDFLTATAASAAALPFVSLSQIFANSGDAKKILFFSRSQGFEHSPIKFDDKGDCLAARKLQELAKEFGYEVVSTKDGKVFDSDLSQYASFVFYTTGDLDKEGGDGQNPISADGLKNLFGAIRGGTGFLGFHSSTDTFNKHTGYFCDPVYEQHEYIRMHGGEFMIHGEQQEATVEICDETLPSFKTRKPSFRLHEEWYANKNFAPDMHVLASLQTAGMKKTDHNKCYDRPAFPCVWARKEGKGTVLYCAFGHKDEYWTDGKMDDVTSDLLKASVGIYEISTLPNLKTVCPQADMLQNDWVNGLENTSD